MRRITKKIKAKQFNLPLEEGLLNRVLNSKDCIILDKKVFQNRGGDIVIYLEYEHYETEPSEDDELFDDPNLAEIDFA